MCDFLRTEDAPDECVHLEIEAAGGRLFAAVRPPASEPDLISFDHLPLLHAVEMAKIMADELRTNVAIVDPLGIWHDWLVTWACAPASPEESALAGQA